MTLHSTGYKHWEGERLGIWRRRGVIARQGLNACFQTKWMRYIVSLCWAGSLLQVALLFFLGQLLVRDSLIVRWLENLNPELQSIGNTLTSWLHQHPEASVPATYNLLFFYFSTNLLVLTLIAIALAIPHLITRDLSSNAIIVYSSKAVTRFDYLIGKFFTLFALMSLTWLGPVCAAWLLGNLLSTEWSFFWHSRAVLGHALLYLLSSMIILCLLALGVSAAADRARFTVSLWIALWLLGSALASMAAQTKPWLKYFSFRFNLDQISLAVFQLQNDFKMLEENIPFFSHLSAGMKRSSPAWRDPELTGALAGLGVMLVLAAVILSRKLKPE
jgi:ABC-2 type transport system permease protein